MFDDKYLEAVKLHLKNKDIRPEGYSAFQLFSESPLFMLVMIEEIFKVELWSNSDLAHKEYKFDAVQKPLCE